jgi:hypothetical protein
LTPDLRVALAAPQRDSAAVARIERILKTINALYTVYTHIFVYDISGRIIASTNQASGAAIGTPIDPLKLERVCDLRSEQDYYVTPVCRESPVRWTTDLHPPCGDPCPL